MQMPDLTPRNLAMAAAGTTVAGVALWRIGAFAALRSTPVLAIGTLAATAAMPIVRRVAQRAGEEAAMRAASAVFDKDRAPKGHTGRIAISLPDGTRIEAPENGTGRLEVEFRDGEIGDLRWHPGTPDQRS